MVLNVETGHTSPSDYMRAVAVRENAGVSSYFKQEDYMEFAKEVMEDYRIVGS